MAGGGETTHLNNPSNEGAIAQIPKSYGKETEIIKTLGSPEEEFRKLVQEMKTLRSFKYVNDDGHLVSFYASNEEFINVSIYDDNNKEIYRIFLSKNPKGDYIDWVYDGEDSIMSPDVNGKDKDITFKVLVDIKKYIYECKLYRKQKEQEEQKFPLIVKFNELFDKLPKTNDRWGRGEEDKVNCWGIKRRSDSSDSESRIGLRIGGDVYIFERNWINGKFTLGVIQPNYRYELHESETKIVLEIVEKLLNGDKSVKLEDLPSEFLAFLTGIVENKEVRLKDLPSGFQEFFLSFQLFH